MTTVLSGQHTTLPVYGGAYSCLYFGHYAWLTPFGMADENAPCGGLPTRCVSSSRKADPAPRWRPIRPNNKFLVRAVGDKGPGGNAHNFVELISSVVVVVPSDYTRYI
jgi:hypothetical protein